MGFFIVETPFYRFFFFFFGQLPKIFLKLETLEGLLITEKFQMFRVPFKLHLN